MMEPLLKIRQLTLCNTYIGVIQTEIKSVSDFILEFRRRGKMSYNNCEIRHVHFIPKVILPENQSWDGN